MNLLTVKEVAQALHCGENQVLEFAGRKELRGFKPGKAWIFRPADVEAFVDRKIREQDMGSGK